MPDFADKMKEFGFDVTVKPKGRDKKRHVTIRGNMAACLRAMERHRELKCPENENWYNHNVSDGDEEFKGGTLPSLMANLRGDLDMGPFYEARKKLAETGLMHKLQTELANVAPKRKRRMSEHDGEWDFDRKWDITPFSSTTKALSPGKTVEIEANFSISGSSRSDAIDKYGALVWAISDLIESAGVRTAIKWQVKINSVDVDCTSNALIDMELKKPGQYMAPSLLASAFQANFFRRMGFGMIALCSQAVDKPVAFGLGHCVREDSPIRYENGKITIAPESYHIDERRIERVILQAVGLLDKSAVA